MKKEYTIGDATVIWKPELCIHSGVCFRRLPEVFRPRERPWIQMDKSDIASIIATVQACPSGAISMKTARPPQMLTVEPAPNQNNKVSVITNGPVKVSGPCVVTMPDGTLVEKPNGVSLCRCGGSGNKPFCDGSHKANGFVG